MHSQLRKDWLKGFFRSHTPPKKWKQYDDIDTWSDSTVNETIAEIHSDLKKAVRENPVVSVKELDEDFVEYLQEAGYDELDTTELAIEFAEWAKDAVEA